jgi:hypothetical protein
MSKSGKGNARKKTKAAAKASAALKGQATTREQQVNVAGMAERAQARQSWLNKPMLGTRITWRAVLLFLLACVMLDGILWAVFELGLGRCYGLLCLI